MDGEHWELSIATPLQVEIVALRRGGISKIINAGLTLADLAGLRPADGPLAGPDQTSGSPLEVEPGAVV